MNWDFSLTVANRSFAANCTRSRFGTLAMCVQLYYFIES